MDARGNLSSNPLSSTLWRIVKVRRHIERPREIGCRIERFCLVECDTRDGIVNSCWLRDSDHWFMEFLSSDYYLAMVVCMVLIDSHDSRDRGMVNV